MVQELEQFLGKGNERVFWIFTIKNAGGLIGGGLLGSRIGALLGGGGLLLACVLLGALLGVILTLERRGLMWGRRWWLAGRWALRRAVHPTVIDAATWYDQSTTAAPPIVIRAQGQTLLAPHREEG